MSANFSGTFKVGKIKAGEKYTLVNLSSFEHVKYGEVDRYDWSNWRCKFVGQAHRTISGLREKDLIVIPAGKAKIGNVAKKDDSGSVQSFDNPFVTVFEWEPKETKRPISTKSDEDDWLNDI